MVSMLTDKGIVRNHNEDYCLYYESDDYNIYVVCDGMGGHKAGEIASELTSKYVIQYINENFLELQESYLFSTIKISTSTCLCVPIALVIIFFLG